MLDNEYDKILNIKTTGRDDSKSDLTNFPYEATPYEVLECLIERDYIKKNNTLIDFGCGKGRCSFFISYQTKCHSIGIEFSKILYDRAISNRSNSRIKGRVEFVYCDAKDYIIPINADIFYFFNPFSYLVLEEVYNNIIKSYNENKRRMLFIFYYPSINYINFLNSKCELSLLDKIDTSYIFNKDDAKENILIYEIKD